MKLPVTAGVGLSAGSGLLRPSSGSGPATFPPPDSNRGHHCGRSRHHHPRVRRDGDGGLSGLCSGCQGHRPGRIRQGSRPGNSLQQPQLRCWGRNHLRSEILLGEKNMIWPIPFYLISKTKSSENDDISELPELVDCICQSLIYSMLLFVLDFYTVLYC